MNAQHNSFTPAWPLHACRRLGPWLQHQRPDFQMLLEGWYFVPVSMARVYDTSKRCVFLGFLKHQYQKSPKNQTCQKGHRQQFSRPILLQETGISDWDGRRWNLHRPNITKALGKQPLRSLRLSIFVPKLSAVHHLICKGLILLIVFVNCPNSNNNEKETQKLSNQS